MTDLIRFILSNFWRFTGSIVLIIAISQGAAAIIRAARA
jgi:hypothetical protein